MTQQELIDHNVRLTLGDLMVQIVVLKSQITELEAQLAQATQHYEQPPTIRPNGAGEEATDGRPGN